jgi:hypothetical protein
MRLCSIFWYIAAVSFLASMIFSLFGGALVWWVVGCNIFGWVMWAAGLVSRIRGNWGLGNWASFFSTIDESEIRFGSCEELCSRRKQPVLWEELLHTEHYGGILWYGCTFPLHYYTLQCGNYLTRKSWCYYHWLFFLRFWGNRKVPYLNGRTFA